MFTLNCSLNRDWAARAGYDTLLAHHFLAGQRDNVGEWVSGALGIPFTEHNWLDEAVN